MSNKAPDSARGHCERASERLKRAADILAQTEELHRSIARLKVGSSLPPENNNEQQPPPIRRTPSVVLIRDSRGDLRVKKD